MDGAHDVEPHPAGAPTPRALLQPHVPFEPLVACNLTWPQGPREQAHTLGLAPPARLGQGKTPDDGFIFTEHNDLATARTLCQGSECNMAKGQSRGAGSSHPVGRRGFPSFSLERADTCTADLAPGLLGQDRSERPTTPLSREGTMLPRVLIDEPIEGLGELTGPWRRATRTGAVAQALRALGGTADEPTCAARHR